MPAEPRLTRQGRAPRIGIVHLGPGAFFRAFTAIYTAEAMAAAGGDWGILAVGLSSAAARDVLAPQGHVYTAAELGPGGPRWQVIGSIAGALVAAEDPGAVIAAMADPGVRIVTLTVTEKGYCHHPAAGRLNEDHPDIRHDLAHPGAPRSAPGVIVAALSRRRALGLRPFTVLSCDNLPANGAVARGVVTALARLVDPGLADWIGAEGRFPSTMVDRITPATTPDDIARLDALTGRHDPAAVFHEPFRQWVIEDDFVDGARPAWDRAGAEFVADVSRHEVMKLRCLNGTHSALAYLGYLAGDQTIADTVADRVFAGYCRGLWRDEILPTVPPPEGTDLAAYAQALFRRYANPGVRHRTWQIAMDGSQKLPQRLLGTIRDRLAAGSVPRGLCLAVAGWMRYAGGMDETGAAIDVRDPLAARLRAASAGGADAEARVAAFLAMAEVFPPDLAADPRFRQALAASLSTLEARGARAAVAALA